MQHYKNYPIHTTAVSTNGGAWRGRGVVLDPQAKIPKEIKRIDTVSDLIFLNKEDAETFAFMLCKAWIDSLAPRSTM